MTAKMAVIAQACEQIEHAEQKADNTEHTPRIRIGEEEQLGNGNDDEHQTHSHVHAGGVESAKLGVLASSGTKAVVH